jgi:hypothetical protein
VPLSWVITAEIMPPKAKGTKFACICK